MALRAVHRIHPGGDFLPHPVGGSLPKTTLQVVGNPFKLGVVGGFDVLGVPHHLDFFSLGAIQQDVHHLLGQLFNRCVQRKMVVL